MPFLFRLGATPRPRVRSSTRGADPKAKLRCEPLDDRIVPAGELGLRADYYNAASSVFSASSLAVTTTPVLTRIDPAVAFDWGTGSPAGGVNADTFAVRWSGQVKAVETGSYTFRVSADDGVRLWVNGAKVIDSWTTAANPRVGTAVTLTAGQLYDIRLDYYEGSGSASAKLEWDRPDGTSGNYAVVPAAQLYPFSKPINITTGGTYVGSWESPDPNTNVVRISTTAAVTVTDSYIRGKTRSNNESYALLNTGSTFYTDLTVRNTRFLGMKPGVANDRQARAINVLQPQKLTIENNYIEGTYGIRAMNYQPVAEPGYPTGTGNNPRRADFVRIRYNEAHNLDGRREDANGDYIEWSGRTLNSDPTVKEIGSDRGYFVQIHSMWNQPNVEIAWNQVYNDPFASMTHDVVAIPHSGGTADSPMLIHNNYVQGSYQPNPTKTGTTTDGTWTYTYTPAGTAMQINDNGAMRDAGHVKVYENQAINTTNSGITLSGGHNIEIFNNRIITSSRAPDGTILAGTFVAMYAWDYYNEGPSLFYNNSVHDNVLGWMVSDGKGGLTRRDYQFRTPGSKGATISTPPDGVTWTNNTSLTADPKAAITLADEQAEWTRWKDKLVTQGVTVGLTSAIRYPALADNAPTTIQVENYDQTFGAANVGTGIGYLANGDWVRFRNVDLGSVAPYGFRANVATTVTVATIQVRSGSPTGTLLGTLAVSPTGGFDTYTAQAGLLDAPLSGVQDVYLVFTGAVNVDWFQFIHSTPVSLIGAGSVPENTTGAAAGTLAPTDPTNTSVLAYSLPDGLGNNSRFEIATVAGLPTLRTKVGTTDYETTPNLYAHVQITDAYGLSYTKVFPITVTNVNETPTDVTLSGTSVAENLAVGTVVGTLSTTDPDAGDTFTYTLVTGTGSTDNASFSLAGNQIKTAAVFNFEAKSSYSIRVQAKDTSGLTFEKVFTITVSNANEAPTGITLTGAQSIAENTTGSVAGTLTATDPDAGDTLTYSLPDGLGNNVRFEIANVSGQFVLRTRGNSTDYETTKTLYAHVRVTDGGGLAFTKVFVIGVTNVAEASLTTTRIDAGTAQRSVVRSVTIAFDAPVVIDANAFTATRASDGLKVVASVATQLVDGKSVVTLTFSGAGTEFGSLADGVWTITAAAGSIRDAGTNRNVYAGGYSTSFHRLFGDADGDRDVDATDYSAFRAAYGSVAGGAKYVAHFDFNGDGVINGTDQTAMRGRYGRTI